MSDVENIIDMKFQKTLKQEITKKTTLKQILEHLRCPACKGMGIVKKDMTVSSFGGISPAINIICSNCGGSGLKFKELND